MSPAFCEHPLPPEMSSYVNPIDEARWRAEEKSARTGMVKAEADREERAARWRDLLPMVGSPDPATMSAVDVMETAMRLAALDGDWERAADLAAKSAPYRHSKLSNVTQTMADAAAGRSTEDLESELAELEEMRRAIDDAGSARRDRARALAPPVPNGSGGVGRAGSAPVERGTGEAPPTAVH